MTQHTQTQTRDTSCLVATEYPPAPYHPSLYLIASERCLFNPTGVASSQRWTA